MSWPRAYTTASISIEGNSAPAEGESGYVMEWSLSATFPRVPLLGLNPCISLIPQIEPGQFAVSIDCCNPTQPRVEVNADGVSEPVECGTRQAVDADHIPVGDPVTLYGRIAIFQILPAWESAARIGRVKYPEDEDDSAPVATIHLADVSGTPRVHGEQKIWAAHADASRAMLGTIEASWPDTGGLTFHFLLTYSRTGNPVVTEAEPVPDLPEWSPTTAYAVGDVASFEGGRYEALKAHLLTDDEDPDENSPDLRPDLWREFNILNHVEVTAIENGARFGFVGRYAHAVSVAAMSIDGGEVKAYAVEFGVNAVGVGYDLFLLDGGDYLTLLSRSSIGATTDDSPGDGDFAATITGDALVITDDDGTTGFPDETATFLLE